MNVIKEIKDKIMFDKPIYNYNGLVFEDEVCIIILEQKKRNTTISLMK